MKKKKKEKEKLKKESKWMKKEESKLKTWKGKLEFNGGHPSWKLIKGGSGKGRKPQRAIWLMKSSHQKVKVKSEVLFRRIKIVGHVWLLKKGSGSWIEMTSNVHCSNIFIYLYVCKYELICYIWYYYYTFSMKSLV